MFRVVRPSIGLVVVLGLAGCGDGADPLPMSGPSAPTAPAPITPTAPPGGPSVRPPITLSVTRGTTRGGTGINLTATEFTGTVLQQGATVTFGTTLVRTYFDPQHQDVGLFVDTPAHTAGLIDVTIVNPNGQTFLLSQGYEYAPQESFDFNGEWTGGTNDGSDVYLQFTIRNDVLVTASCQGDSGGVTRTVGLSTAVRNGEFSSGPHEGFVLSGRITSGFQARGQITAPCSSTTHPYWVVLNDH